MTLFQFRDDSGEPIDAHYEALPEGTLILHSRGGTIGTPSARNTEYSAALRILLWRIHRSNLTLEGVWVDSERVQDLPLRERNIFLADDSGLDPEGLFSRLSTRMAAVGRDPEHRAGRGNATKKLRFAFAEGPSQVQIIRIAGWGKVQDDLRRLARIPVAELSRVTADLIWRVMQGLLSGSVEHPFAESTHYDVIADSGVRLPPKAVFGLAASKALGFQVLPHHFSAGHGTPCFSGIRRAGYRIVAKGSPSLLDEVPASPEDRTWAEGRPKLVTHLKRERAAGLAAAKKALFLKNHGRLWCERCRLDPLEKYGPDTGGACIEVHHRIPLAEIRPGQVTRLDDLMCLCANCHRVVHRELRHYDQRDSDTTD